MLTEVINATNALEGFATYIATFWTDQPYNLAVGAWNVPPLTRDDLASRARRLASNLKGLEEASIDADLKALLVRLPDQLAWFQANTIPQLSGGNAPVVLASFEMIMSNAESALPSAPLVNWEVVSQSQLIPKELASKIRALEAAVKQHVPRTARLDEMLKRIEDANATALSLPADVQMLAEARDEIIAYSNDAKAAADNAATSNEASKQCQTEIATHEATARQLISNIDSAYSTATTAGLAAAFSEKAKQLGGSTWAWVALLLGALSAGGIIGFLRLQVMQQMLVDKSIAAEFIWLNAAMSFFAIAAPVWFAWIATRQIGQRFRLAEDYAFKAAVARAYEGYRKEAARLDPQLEARLFASALDRLEEAPLRFLALEEHGSPYEALLASGGFQNLLNKFPDLRQSLQDALDNVPSVKDIAAALPKKGKPVTVEIVAPEE